MTYAMPRGPHRRHSAQSYASVGLETEVLSATPERLITLLFNGARAAIAKARLFIQNENIAERGVTISKAIDIVESGLKASVNTDVGGEVATNLIASYDLIVRNLMLANLRNDITQLDAADQALAQLADAWKSVTEPIAETSQPG
jgi:flagellar protein FliS